MLVGENSFGGDFLSEDVRPKKKPQRIIEPSGRTWCVRVCVYAWRDARMCVCVYVCMCVRSHACMYVCAYICALAHVHAYMYACLCAHTHVCMRMRVCACMVCVRACDVHVWCVCMCASMPMAGRQKAKKFREIYRNVYPHVVLKSFSFVVRSRELYILPTTPIYATNFLTLLYEKYEAKNKGVEES